ncbi:MAG: nucleotidyl transferase AbiEii/AbiGii toxin family protein [Desulfohalobiaceae bacterium]
MAEIDYSEIYALQDKVLAAIYSGNTSFYLTAGTCLHRFYLHRRYSEDLDLFTSENALFREDVRAAQDLLDVRDIDFKIQVDTRDFVRLNVASKLRVDMVNDRVYRYGRNVRSTKGVVLDNIENISANKLCAVLGRDEPKDVFDLYVIFKHMHMDWRVPIEAAEKKCVLDGEELEYRLSSFPLHLLDLLPVVDKQDVSEMKSHYDEFVFELSRMT